MKFKLPFVYSWPIVKTAGLRQIITKGKTGRSCFPLFAEVWLAHGSLDINQFEKVNNKNIARWISVSIIWLIKITVTFQSSVDVYSGLYSNHGTISLALKLLIRWVWAKVLFLYRWSVHSHISLYILYMNCFSSLIIHIFIVLLANGV